MAFCYWYLFSDLFTVQFLNLQLLTKNYWYLLVVEAEANTNKQETDWQIKLIDKRT